MERYPICILILKPHGPLLYLISEELVICFTAACDLEMLTSWVRSLLSSRKEIKGPSLTRTYYLFRDAVTSLLHYQFAKSQPVYWVYNIGTHLASSKPNSPYHPHPQSWRTKLLPCTFQEDQSHWIYPPVADLSVNLPWQLSS